MQPCEIMTVPVILAVLCDFLVNRSKEQLYSGPRVQGFSRACLHLCLCAGLGYEGEWLEHLGVSVPEAFALLNSWKQKIGGKMSVLASLSCT